MERCRMCKVDDDNSETRSSSSVLQESPTTRSPPPAVVTVGRGGETEQDDVVAGDDTVPLLDELDDEENSVSRKRQKSRADSLLAYTTTPRRYFRYAICLWIAEFVLVVSLKHLGVLEKGFRLEKVMTEQVLPRINESIPALPVYPTTPEKKRPGYILAEQGATAHFPVVLIPGFVTSGLELWTGKECGKKFFRQRLWAAFTGARSFVLERDCFQEHMMLDPFSGLDPEGIRLRASEGFDAADYFLGNYWVWSKLIMNLADVGYTPSLMSMEAYDWRLSFPMLEKRDGYLTRLRYRIEAFRKTTGRKVVLTSHSMGGNLVLYFFAWVTRESEGGSTWVEDHIHAYINIAGTHLGVPKAASALLSGEMSDTIFTGMMSNMAEQFFGRRRRRDLWNTWGSLWGMLPKGGNALWSIGADICSNESSNDPFCSNDDRGSPLLKIATRNETSVKAQEEDIPDDASPSIKLAKAFASQENHTVEDVLEFLQNYGGGLGPHTAATRDFSLFGPEQGTSRVWHDPARTPLPNAPNMRLYCFYGVGKDTERAYYYRNHEDTGSSTSEEDGNRAIFDPPVIHDPTPQSDSQNTQFGVRFTNGDGSVPLLSLGYLCADAWKRDDSGLNPFKVPITVREYQDEPDFCFDDPMRGGPGSSEHVDILGNLDMTEDVLRVVTDFELEKTSTDRIVSDIEEIAKRINSHPRGGIRRRKGWMDGLFR